MISPKDALLTALNRIGPGKARRNNSHNGADSQAVAQCRLVLASSSPRRLALLEQVGVEPYALRPASVDETPRKGERPRALAQRLARAKALAANERVRRESGLEAAYLLAADTVVACGALILGKPEYLDEAAQALKILSGRTHRVYTSVCLITPQQRLRLRTVETRVRFKRLSREEIASYLACGEWRDKAGGYAVQGIAGSFVQKIVGSYSNVVGLPLNEVVEMLAGEGFPVYFNWLNRAEVETV
jgi:septum formation protein